MEFTVGQQANISFKLAAGTVEVSVEVVAGGEVVDTNRTEQSSAVDAKQITNLPINRRNILGGACTDSSGDRFTPCTAPGAVPQSPSLPALSLLFPGLRYAMIKSHR